MLLRLVIILHNNKITWWILIFGKQRQRIILRKNIRGINLDPVESKGVNHHQSPPVRRPPAHSEASRGDSLR